MTVAVVTVVSGRHHHLRVQRDHLALAARSADLHVVVAVDDPDVADVTSATEIPTVVVHMPSTPAGLPIATARNVGAATALCRGADTLVFLDVDCIPSEELIARLADAVAECADALVSGVVTYLPPAPPSGWTPELLVRNPHPARPDPADGALVCLPTDLFWSLCFATTAQTWQRLEGFHEGYVGYGAEDTDLGARAASLGIALLMLGGADAFHQHHPVSDPPVEHLDDILRNSAVFVRRHGRLPMRGWLEEFARCGRVEPGLNRRTDAVRVASVPPRHPYVDAITPTTVRQVAPGRAHGWQPDPLFDPKVLRDASDGIDVVHLHFGYDRLTGQDMRAWLAVLAALQLPIVVTVHDLRNPHHAIRDRHDGHLRMLAGAATRLITLTGGAALEFERRFGRRPEVIAHPTLVDGARPVAASRRDHILVPLKALRRNVMDPVRVLRAVAAGAARVGLRTRVLIEPQVLGDPRLRGLSGLDVDLDVAPYLVHHDVCARVASARAVVLPYRFGTHSGWVELCRDLGTWVIAPDCGHYAEQWTQVIGYRGNERDGLDARSLSAAVTVAGRLALPAPADRHEREVERDRAVALHDVLYRSVLNSVGVR